MTLNDLENKQTYQEVAYEVKKELRINPDITDVQNHFFELKQKEPARFERLFFDENGHIPYSQDLADIIWEVGVTKHEKL